MAPRQGKSRSAPRDVKCCTRSGQTALPMVSDVETAGILPGKMEV